MALHLRPAEPELGEAQLEDSAAGDVPGLFHDGVHPPTPDLGLLPASDAEWHRGVDEDYDRRSLLRGQIGMPGMPDVAVHVVTPGDPIRLEEAGNGRRG